MQPRAPHPDGPIRRKVYTEAQVIDWMLNTLVPGVELSVSGVGTAFVSGPHCKFCPALATCDHVTAERQSAATRAFDDEDLTQRTEKEIAEDLAQAEVLEEWVKRVRDTAYEMAVQGKKLPGYKLVPKRATRAWTNSAAALAALQMEITLSPADFEAPSEIKSPAQVLGNRNIKAIPSLMKELSGLVSSNSSGTTLARDDDPREEVKPRVSAADAFDLNL